MNFNLQPVLENEWVQLRPLRHEDFETLYQCASDPLIWEQHPVPDRYQRPVFEKFFAGAMESGGAFLVINRATGEAIGTSRYYDIDAGKKSVAIGFTFLVRACWGTTYNRAMKQLMLDHAFQFANYVIFHIGPQNIRSQAAILKLGARKLAEEEIVNYGSPFPDHYVYMMAKDTWSAIRSSKIVPVTKQ